MGNNLVSHEFGLQLSESWSLSLRVLDQDMFGWKIDPVNRRNIYEYLKLCDIAVTLRMETRNVSISLARNLKPFDGLETCEQFISKKHSFYNVLFNCPNSLKALVF